MGPGVRVRLLSAFLVLASLLASPSSAQVDPTPVLEDPADDLFVDAAGTPAPAPVPGAADRAVDLRSLTIAETRSTIAFRIGVAELRPAQQDPNADGSAYNVWFRHADKEFGLRLVHSIPAVFDSWLWSLTVRNGEAWDRVASEFGGVTVDQATATFGVELDRALLVDSDGAAPYPGRSLDSVFVTSVSGAGAVSVLGSGPAAPATLRDRMPDGEATASYAIQVGVVQSGDARLRSETPFRSSNGEATTFAYRVEALNLGAAQDTYTLVATARDPTLSVAFPDPKVEVPGGGTTEFTVLVTVPFAHDHGAAASFVLELRSDSDPASVGRLEMGVRYLAVPQPAGHHDHLYLHSTSGDDPVSSAGNTLPGVVGNDGWLNTLEQDPASNGAPIPTDTGTVVGGEEWAWTVGLSPGLEMGIDMDLTRVGSLRMAIGSTSPLSDASLSAEVVVTSGSEDAGAVVLARMAPTAPMTIQPGEPQTFDGELVPDAAGDLVPFGEGSNLFLRLTLTTPATTVGLPGPYLAEGGSLQLPMLEYHDDVRALAEGAVPAPNGTPPEETSPERSTPAPSLVALIGAVCLALAVAGRPARRR